MTDLCIDTSASTRVALVEGGEVIARAHDGSTRHHAESLTPLVREVLRSAGRPEEAARAGLARVLVGTGPAPFTGLRAGLVTARVIARAAGVPVYGVPSLELIARAALDLLAPDACVVAISDARRKELYWGRFLAEGPDDVRCEGRLEVGAAHSLLNALRGASDLVVAAGAVPAHSAEALAGAESGPLVELDPAVLSRIVSARLQRGQGDSLRTEPLYLRRPEIHGQPMERM